MTEALLQSIQPHEVFDPDEDIEFDDQHKHPVLDDWDDLGNSDCDLCDVVDDCPARTERMCVNKAVNYNLVPYIPH